MRSLPQGLDRNELIDAVLGYRKAKVLMVAAYLELFDRLERASSAAVVARRLSLDSRATEILLDALAAIGCVVKRGGTYRNTPNASRFLVRGKPGYLGNNLKFQEIIWDAWGELRHAVRRGGAVRPLEYWLLKHDGFIDEYIGGMDDIAKGPAREIAAALSLAGPERMLDVGAGPGTYSLAFLRKYPALRADLLDLPKTLGLTRRFLAREPRLAARARLMPGDYRKSPFGRGAYDLVLLSHITHDEGPQVNRRMIRESWRALKPGGRIAIHDFTVAPDRTRPLFGALFSVHMLTYTSSGRTYTSAEYAGWLKEAGFARIVRRPIAAGARNGSQLITAIKEK